MYAAQQGFKVLNLSWGSPKYASDIDQLVIDYAVSRNVAIVAAAGNTGSGSANNYSSFYPATYKGVLGVGEVSATGLLTNESVMGIGTRIMAPGEGDFTTKSNNSYGMCEGGSSFSSPVVAGAVALARSRYPDLDAIQTIEFVRQCTDTFVNQNNKYYKLAPGIINLQKIVTIDPMSIPALRPEKFLYSNSDGFVTDRFSAGDLVHLKVSLKNYLGAANSLTFVLSEAYDPANAVSIVDSVKVIASVAQNGEIELEDFVIAILQNYAEEVILRIDIYGDNGYKDFFKFGFIPIKQITTFENNNFFISLSDNGELGFFTENDTVGSGFGLKNTGNQIYQNSTIMVSEFINENKNRIIYNDNDISRYDFKSIKKFLPPDANLGIINDDFASNNKLGVEIQQRLEFIDDNSNSVRIKLDIKNTGKDTLENVSIGYFIDWDIAGEADNNQVRYLPIDLPTGGFSSNFAVEIATYNDDYPIFGSGVYTNALNVSPQAAGLDYNYIRDFLPNERIATLNSGINIQTDLTTDISSVIGMRFNGKLLPGTSQNCLVCLAAGNSLDEFRLEMIKCLGIPSSVNYNNNITDLEIYPNPANDNIIIRQLSRNANELFIYNQLGNVIHSVMITDSEMKVDISDIANGIYFMISKSKSGKVIDKGTFIILK